MASSVPGAFAYLVTLFTSAVPSDVLVWAGKELPKFTAPITVQLMGVQGDQVPADIGSDYKREETFSVLCSLTSWAGGAEATAFAERMTEVYTTFNYLTLAIGNDPTLGANVRFAEVGDFEYTPESDGQSGNSYGVLTFSVRCSQRITSLT